mgnify:CR=1 FL=1
MLLGADAAGATLGCFVAHSLGCPDDSFDRSVLASPLILLQHRYMMEGLAAEVSAAAGRPGATAASIIAAAATAAPLPALRKFVAVRTAGSNTHGGVCVQTAAVHTFLREVRSMPLFATVAAALPPATPRSRHTDELAATNCYTSGTGCRPPVEGAAGAAAARSGAHVERQLDARTPPPPPPQRAGSGLRGGSSEASASHDSLAATAAASSSPALAASAAEPAVKEDLSVERVCMLLLASPREAWQELVADQQLQQEVLALLDTSAHAGESGMQRWSVLVAASRNGMQVVRLLAQGPRCPHGTHAPATMRSAIHPNASSSCSLPPHFAVVAAEVEYLGAQLWQLPIMQQVRCSPSSLLLQHLCKPRGRPFALHRTGKGSKPTPARDTALQRVLPCTPRPSTRH